MQHTSSSTGTQAIKLDQACNWGKQRMTEVSSAGRLFIRDSAEGHRLPQNLQMPPSTHVQVSWNQGLQHCWHITVSWVSLVALQLVLSSLTFRKHASLLQLRLICNHHMHGNQLATNTTLMAILMSTLPASFMTKAPYMKDGCNWILNNGDHVQHSHACILSQLIKVRLLYISEHILTCSTAINAQLAQWW